MLQIVDLVEIFLTKLSFNELIRPAYPHSTTCENNFFDTFKFSTDLLFGPDEEIL